MAETSAGRSPREGLVLVLVIGLLLAAVAVAASSIVLPNSEESEHPSQIATSAFLDRTGIRIVRVAVTAGGGILDLRYQVVDEGKAGVVHVRAPKLVDEATGTVLDELFMGHAHAGPATAGLTYPLLFVNAGGTVRPGDLVSVEIGEARLEHVEVA